MASKKDQYLTQTVSAKAFGGKRKIEKLIAQGWEIHGQDMGNSLWHGQKMVMLRKPNPKYKPKG